MAKRLKASWSSADRANNPEMERNLQITRAMLAINNEIWNRCKNHMLEPTFDNYAIFQRPQFQLVRASGNFTGEITFSAVYETERETFNIAPLCTCPPNLAIFQFEYLPSYNHHTRFIDFEALLERALLLHDDVLEPFLVELKKHIETIQVALGTIEEWLQERMMVNDFIESSFGVDLSNTFGGSGGEQHLGTFRVSDSHAAEFQVVEESERIRLTNFLDFISVA